MLGYKKANDSFSFLGVGVGWGWNVGVDGWETVSKWIIPLIRRNQATNDVANRKYVYCHFHCVATGLAVSDIIHVRSVAQSTL